MVGVPNAMLFPLLSTPIALNVHVRRIPIRFGGFVATIPVKPWNRVGLGPAVPREACAAGFHFGSPNGFRHGGNTPEPSDLADEQLAWPRLREAAKACSSKTVEIKTAQASTAARDWLRLPSEIARATLSVIPGQDHQPPLVESHT